MSQYMGRVSEMMRLTRMEAFFALGTELCVDPLWLSFFSDFVILKAVFGSSCSNYGLGIAN